MKILSITRAPVGRSKATPCAIPATNIASIDQDDKGGAIVHLKKYPQNTGRKLTTGFAKSQQPIVTAEPFAEVVHRYNLL